MFSTLGLKILYLSPDFKPIVYLNKHEHITVHYWNSADNKRTACHKFKDNYILA